MKRLEEINLIRPFLMLMIVFGHTFALYGDTESWPLPSGFEFSYLYSWFNPIVLSFALQAFVFVSGYIHSYVQKNRHRLPLQVVERKLIRLYLPCVVFGTLYVFLIEGFTKYNSIGLLIISILSGVGHLWFLPMLFLCFLIFSFIENSVGKPSIITFLVLSIFCFSSLFVPAFYRLPEFLFYFVFFVTGYWAESFRESFVRFSSFGLLLLTILLFSLMLLKGYSCVNGGLTAHFYLETWVFRYLIGLIGSFVTLIVALKITAVNHSRSIIEQLNWGGWFGVYIVHQFILKIIYYRFDYSTTRIGLVYPWFVFILVSLSSFFIVYYLRRSKIGRFLLG